MTKILIFMTNANIVRRYRRSLIIIFIGLTFLLPFGYKVFFNQNFTFNSGVNNEYYLLKSSVSVSPIFINGSGTGVGAHNWTWVESQTWFDSGNGSWNNPYLIKDISIDGSEANTCFEVVDSNKYFTLDNCFLGSSGSAPQAGLIMENVNNSEIINGNIRFNDGDGINLTSCTNINITNTYISYNEGNGATFTSVNYATLYINYIEGNLADGIYVENSGNITLQENYIDSNSFRGANFNFVNHIYLLENTIQGNDHEGIMMQLVNNSLISGNKVKYNRGDGLIFGGVNNKIIDNTFNYNYVNGITSRYYNLLDSCHDNTFQKNEMNGNGEFGMELMLSTDNIIIENSMNDNELVGFDSQYGDNNNVTGNIINNNEGNYGIYLENSDNNTIAENQIIGQKGTIYQGSCSGNIIINNIYEILKNIFIEISDQTFSSDFFNITLFIHDENNSGITVDSIQMEWNGTDVSSSVVAIGTGLYFVSLTPITVSPGDDSILLNITVSADGYVVKHLGVNLAVDPETLLKNTPQNPNQPLIPGYNLIVLFIVVSCVSLVLIRKKIK